jgi:hypothetical protein
MFVVFSCKNEGAKTEISAEKAATDSANFTSVVFTDSVQNLGILKMGEKAEIKFHFTNDGDKPLFIISAQPSCGCTVADFPKEPIAPGGEGVITANFNTKGQAETFTKVITVMTNTKPSANHALTFLGEIKSSGTDSSNTEKKTN